MMPEPSTCPSCGAALPADAPKGFCPRCLYHLGFTEAENPALPAEPAVADLSLATRHSSLLRPFGDYELLKEIGYGGMGIVYEARQRSLDRIVALKLLLFGPHAAPDSVKRFRAEAISAAALHHPNIVAIHEVGFCEGQHFIAMDYVEGQPLSALIRGTPLPARRAAGYVKSIAEAIHHAHERGILHRDLTPANVLIDTDDQPRVTDFGLAKRIRSDAQLSTQDSQLTLTGQVLGSPTYMPPEQASGKRGTLSRRTDVYALGAILYHALTGRPPFVGEGLTDTLQQVLNTEPVSPRTLNPSVPRDLETVCLKCLEKEPAKRYPTALALAVELGRFLEGKPVLARPVGRLAKAWRWGRRNPRLASTMGAALLSLLIGLAGVGWQWRRAESQRQRAEADKLRARQHAYVLAMNLAQQALKANNPNRALELLNRHRPTGESEIRIPRSEMDLRGFEWRYLWQQCQSEAEAVLGKLPSTIWSLEVSADGQWLLGTSHGGSVNVWNLSTGEEIPLASERGVNAWATFSLDSRLLLFCDQNLQSSGTIAVWDLQGRKRLTPITDPRPVGPMAFSPDGRWFGYAFAFQSSRKGYWGKGIVLQTLPSQEKVMEVVSRTEIVDLKHATDWLFTPDSRSVIFSEAAPDCRIALCDLVPGSEPRHFPAHREATTAMAISRHGTLATGAGFTDKSIRLWEVPSFRLMSELRGHEGWISALRFSPDGRTLASASADQTIRLWDLTAKKPRRVIPRLAGEVSRLSFSPDGQKLFSGASDGTILRWSAEAEPTPTFSGFSRTEAKLESVTIAPDAKLFAGLRQGVIYVGEFQGPTTFVELRQLGTNNTCLLFAAEGRHLFAGTEVGDVQVWTLDPPGPVRRLRGPAEPAAMLRQDKQGQALVAVHWENKAQLGLPARVVVWNTTDWQQRKAWTIPEAPSVSEVSPDGRWLATVTYRGPLQVWNLTDPSKIRTASSPGGTQSLAFSPDGRLLAAATVGGMVRVWEMPTLRELTAFRARSQSLFALAFSPDSRRLATAGEGAEAIKLWDVATWQELIALDGPEERIERLAFSTDGHQLTASNSQGDLLFWRVPSFLEIAARDKARGTR